MTVIPLTPSLLVIVEFKEVQDAAKPPIDKDSHIKALENDTLEALRLADRVRLGKHSSPFREKDFSNLKKVLDIHGIEVLLRACLCLVKIKQADVPPFAGLFYSEDGFTIEWLPKHPVAFHVFFPDESDSSFPTPVAEKGQVRAAGARDPMFSVQTFAPNPRFDGYIDVDLAVHTLALAFPTHHRVT